ncbi:MAG: SxtJ family membrane protein [Planctomycetota bacterium]|nr:SxtJ family membrane protein [Planctomycetota bacterium]
MKLMEINWQPSRKEMKFFAVLQIAFFAIISSIVWKATESTTGPIWIMGISVSVGVVGFFVHPFMRLVYLGWLLAVFPIGWTISQVVVAGIFFLVITPIGLIMRVFRYDPMQRKFDPNASTYWLPRESNTKSTQYFRQY